jgi:hypothetical protein
VLALHIKWYQSWKFLLIYFRQEEVEQRESTLIHIKWYQGGNSVCILQAERVCVRAEEDRVTGGLCEDLLAGRQQSINSLQTAKMKLVELMMRNDSSIICHEGK